METPQINRNLRCGSGSKAVSCTFYVCAPTSTIDLNTATGDDICIEERPAEEVTEMWYQERMAPEGVKYTIRHLM